MIEQQALALVFWRRLSPQKDEIDECFEVCLYFDIIVLLISCNSSTIFSLLA